jgi:hypothetical protein
MDRIALVYDLHYNVSKTKPQREIESSRTY